MNIKSRLTLGIGFLFLMIAGIGALSIVYLYQLKADTREILTANYNSVDYARQMMQAINQEPLQPEMLQLFEGNLHKQEENITEAGEDILTGKLKSAYHELLRGSPSPEKIHEINQQLAEIIQLNMQAIQRKELKAVTTSDTALTWISLLSTVCFLVALSMLFNLPGNIANPIRELTASIRQIAQGNYKSRLHFKSSDEYGDLAASFNTMAEKLEEYQASNLQQLLIEKKRIEALINNMHDPVIGLNEHNRMLFMNDAASRILSLKTTEVLGKTAEELSVRNDLMRNLIRDVHDTQINKTIHQEPLKIYADNKESYFERYIIPIQMPLTGETEIRSLGNVLLLRNITPYKELDFAKTHFIATVSHELKTPIASIKMGVQLLESPQVGSLNAEQQQLLQSIRDDAGRLLKITGELLDMTQVETGKIHLDAAPADPVQIMQEAVDANRVAAEIRKIELILSVPHPVSKVMADINKTTWVMINLVSNAIRYSHEQANVAISIREENSMICFEIRDHGAGIAPQYLNRIFDRYFRIPGTQQEGTGLGLSICNEFISAQGGRIDVSSDMGTGSCFRVWLPHA